MKIEEFLVEADRMLCAKWEDERESYNCTAKDAHIAAVLNRIDTGVNLSANVYNSKILSSINIAVWGILFVLTLQFVVKIL